MASKQQTKKADRRPKRTRTDEWIQQQTDKEMEFCVKTVEAKEIKKHPGGHGKNGTVSQAYHVQDPKMDRDYENVFRRKYKTIVWKKSAGNVNIVVILFPSKKSWNTVEKEFDGARTRPTHWRQAKHLFKPNRRTYVHGPFARGEVDSTLQTYIDEGEAILHQNLQPESGTDPQNNN